MTPRNMTDAYVLVPREKYRAKIGVVEAVQWWPDPELGGFNLLGDMAYRNRRVGHDKYGVEYTVCDCVIRTPRGALDIKPGDWIVTDNGGVNHLCAAKDFPLQYEPLSASPTEGRPLRGALDDLLEAASEWVNTDDALGCNDEANLKLHKAQRAYLMAKRAALSPATGGPSNEIPTAGVTEWQDIQTAPKDGTRIIAATFCEDLETGAWRFFDYPVTIFWAHGEWYGWHSDYDELATHWQPLPAPPALRTGEPK